MNNLSRGLILIAWASTLLVIGNADARSSKHGLDEGAALSLLLQTLKRDHAYDKRISLDCVTFTTDEITRTYFEFALREKHTAKCGGDPDVSPVVDRYRVQRGSGNILWYDASKDFWESYGAAKK